ncbi:hypothetical protein [Frankia sp. CiP1_Cm_nod2]|uniref:hypothetical protein n=1 Tax=Frankia sp. CiP1_Cm_nod2 TaxID=2897161 RepID=UPI002023CDD4
MKNSPPPPTGRQETTGHARYLVLIDRGFDSNTFLTKVAATGAQFLARCMSTRRPLSCTP